MRNTSWFVAGLAVLATATACGGYSSGTAYPTSTYPSSTASGYGATQSPSGSTYVAPSGGGAYGGAQAGNVVQIRNHTYQPSTISVRAGDSVKWVNYDTVAHTVTCPQEPAVDFEIGPGQERSYTFATAGEFGYVCRYHPQMKGHVSVRAR